MTQPLFVQWVDVFPYSIEKLIGLFAEDSRSTPERVAKKLHLTYFEGYFDHIGAKTIVVERDYIDHDYLEDFSAYYVKCFEDYARKCKRLHFFRSDFSAAQLKDILSGEGTELTEDNLKEDNYLGFIVVKPLPQTIIGRTCLCTYPSEGRRHFPITRHYEAHLFGIRLCINNTLAFQEQDSVVAACATSALWSTFQGTGKLFQHPIPSPVEITKAATEQLPSESRALPNHGLNPLAMANAIRSVGLEPYHLSARKHSVLKSTVYAYLRGKIPLILGLNLVDTTDNPAEAMGLHAVAVTGYSLGHETAKPQGETGFLSRASKIDKIYVHDDGVGPFARMEFDGKDVTLSIDGGGVKYPSIATSWQGKNGIVGSGRAISEILLIPLYHKIRITFSTVENAIIIFDSLLTNIAPLAKNLFPARLEWDIYLSTLVDLKAELLKKNTISGNYRAEMLIKPLPRFLWRASAFRNSELLFDILFDATDIEQGPCVVQVIEYDNEVMEFMHEIFSEAPGFASLLPNRLAQRIAIWFKEHPRESE